MTYTITDECIACGACANECAEDAIYEKNGVFVIDSSLCRGCGTCADVCPVGAPVGAVVAA